MAYSYYVIDAFTQEVFKGNPAGIVMLDTWLDDGTMQKIATENNLSETAFIVPSADENVDFDIAYFTPTHEIDLCGHATLGTGVLLKQKLGWAKDKLTLKTRNKGQLYIGFEGDKVAMDLPQYSLTPMAITDRLEKVIGYRILTALKGNHLILRLEKPEYVQDFRPDFAAIAQLDPAGIVLTAQSEKGADSDFASRVFVPNVGIDEDPVTGVAHAELFPYWAQVLNKEKMIAFQSSKRGGYLEGEVQKNSERVLISGYGKLYLEGTIHTQ